MNKMHLILVLAVSVLLLATVCAPAVRAQQPWPVPQGPAVVGGHEAQPGAWPWQVALIHSTASEPGPYYGAQFCGGSLIDEVWVLTAAHCVYNTTTQRINVVAGVHNLVTPEAGHQRRAVTQVIIQDFDPYRFDNDIALLRLNQPVSLGVTAGGITVGLVSLVPATVGSLSGITATVTGWGERNASVRSRQDYPAALQEVSVPIVSNTQCQNWYDANGSGGYTISANMLCAGFEAGGKDTCYGDSGGPLVVYDQASQRWQLAGITSFGEGRARPALPGVYTRVSRYADWVKSYVGGLVISGSAPTYVEQLTTPVPIPITYTFLVENTSSVTMTQVAITDAIPIGAHYLSESARVFPPAGSTFTVDAGPALRWTIAQLAPHAGVTVTFALTATTTVTNSAYGAQDSAGRTATGNDQPIVTIIDPTPRLSVSLSQNTDLSRAGQVVTYTYTVHNKGYTTLNVSAIDDQLGPVPLAQTVLKPQQGTYGTRNYTLSSADLPGPLVHRLTATGTNGLDAQTVMTGEATLSILQIVDIDDGAGVYTFAGPQGKPVSLTLPAGAVSGTVQLRYAAYPETELPPPARASHTGFSALLGAWRSETVYLPSFTFLKPVTLSVPYDPTRVRHPNSMFLFNESNPNWVSAKQLCQETFPGMTYLRHLSSAGARVDVSLCGLGTAGLALFEREPVVLPIIRR